MHHESEIRKILSMKIVAIVVALFLACGAPQIEYSYEPGEITWTSMQSHEVDDRKTNNYVHVYVCYIQVTGEVSGPLIAPWGFSPESMGEGMCFAADGTPASIMWQNNLDTGETKFITFVFDRQK